MSAATDLSATFLGACVRLTYSSLAYLRQFPVDSLKIDRTFITGLSLSREAHALTHTLIQLGKALGLSGARLHGLRRAGVVHDIGKIVVPDSVLLKPTALTAGEASVSTPWTARRWWTSRKTRR